MEKTASGSKAFIDLQNKLARAFVDKTSKDIADRLIANWPECPPEPKPSRKQLQQPINI
jgi:hypothetical protein